MRFIIDECTGSGVARWILSQSYEAYSVADQSPGWKDTQVLDYATKNNIIVVTNDRDFEELIF